MSVSALYPFKSLFLRKKKEKQQDVAPPPPPQRRREEDTFALESPQDTDVPSASAGDRLTFDAASGPSILAARQTDVPSTSAGGRLTFDAASVLAVRQTEIRSERLHPGPSRPVDGYAFTKVEIPYSRKQGKILSDQEKADILLNQAEFQGPAKLMGFPGGALMPGHKIQDRLEDTERPIFLETTGDHPEVHELKITRLRKFLDESHDEVVLRRHPNQSIESFVTQGLQNALNLGKGMITPQEAAHNPAGENPSENIFHYGTNPQLIKKYMGEVQAEKKATHLTQGRAHTDYFKSSAIPQDETVSIYTQQGNLQQVRGGGLHPTGKTSDKSYVPPNPEPLGLAPASLGDWAKAGETSHQNDEIRSESSEHSEGSPQADYRPLPEALVNDYKQYAARAYDMVTPFPGEPKRDISLKAFPEILKKRLEKPSAEYLRLLEASDKRRKQGRKLEEAPLSRIRLLENLFIHPDDRDYARGLTSKDELLDVMARRHNKRTDSPEDFSFHAVETGEPSHPVSEITAEPSPGFSFNIGEDRRLSRVVEGGSSPGFSFNIGEGGQLSRVSEGSPEIVEVSASQHARPEAEITEEHPSQPQLAQLSMEALNKEIAQAKRNTLGAALDAQAAADRIKALKKTPLPKLWNALMPQSRLRHEAIKDTKARLKRAQGAAQQFEAKEKALETKVAAHETHHQYAPLSKKEVQAYEKLRDEIFAKKGTEGFQSEIDAVAKHSLDLEDALKSAEKKQKLASRALGYAISAGESGDGTKEAVAAAQDETESALNAVNAGTARIRLLDKLFLPELYEPLQEQRKQKLHLKYIHGPSIGPHESQAEANLAKAAHEHVFGKPGLRREMTMSAYDGADRDLKKARNSANTMLPQSLSSAADQPETSRAREILTLPAVTEEDIQTEMTALREKAATKAKEQAKAKAAAADLEVKTAEAQLKALKKTPLPKWWNALMPQSKARHMAIKETQARLTQARIDAQQAEAFARQGENPVSMAEPEFDPSSRIPQWKAWNKIDARMRRERGLDPSPQAIAQRQQAEWEAFVPWARKEGIPENLWMNR